jgi:hypothetical protein
MNSNQDRIFEWYDFLKYDLEADKVNINFIRPPSARPKELIIDKTRYDKLAQMISDDSRHAAIKNNYSGDAGFFKAAIDVYMHELITKTAMDGRPHLQCWAGSAGAVNLRRRHRIELRNSGWRRQSARLRLGFFEAVVLPRNGSTSRNGSLRLLLHSREQLLLPLASIQSGPSRRHQET